MITVNTDTQNKGLVIGVLRWVVSAVLANTAITGNERGARCVAARRARDAGVNWLGTIRRAQ